MIDWHLIVSCRPIRKLLVSINQSSYLIYFGLNLFYRAKSIKWKQVYKIEENTFADFDLFDFSSFIFKKLALSLNETTFQNKRF